MLRSDARVSFARQRFISSLSIICSRSSFSPPFLTKFSYAPSFGAKVSVLGGIMCLVADRTGPPTLHSDLYFFPICAPLPISPPTPAKILPTSLVLFQDRAFGFFLQHFGRPILLPEVLFLPPLFNCRLGPSQEPRLEVCDVCKSNALPLSPMLMFLLFKSLRSLPSRQPRLYPCC